MNTDSASPNVTPIALEDEMRSSFMDYAMSVIVSRALPDARDGLKPVHRRILFAQQRLSNFWNRPYLKCARVVGDVIGKYHPHGDSAVYDALVRLAQDFSMRNPLVDGQGNFGSMDGDPPAAMRYTECRMARIASELLADIDKETVDWQLNYDDKELEPRVLPTKVPNLLVNGSSGIAVGMATNIPPHNLREVVAATLALIDDPHISDDALRQIVPGPDFPTGGIIQGREGCIRAATLGRGSIVLRGRAEVEEWKKDRERIVVTEMPYMVNKARWIETCARLVREKKLEGISDMRDETARQGVRVVFELKRDANSQVVLNSLYKMTALQTTFGVNMLAIVDGKPKLMNLRDALGVFIEHRRDVVTKRSLFDLRKARERREIVEGLGLAIMQVDRVIEIIRSSKDTDEARTRLMAEKMLGLEGFLERAGRPAEEVEAVREKGFVFLTERQAQAILDMRLGRLTGLEREKLEAEYKELWEKTDYLQGILSNDGKLMAAIVEELNQISDQYGDDRRTEIAEAGGDILIEELIAEEEMVVTRSHNGYVKRTPVSEYSAQKRGGKGIKGASSADDDDFISDMFVASTHDHLMCFTNSGRVYAKKVYELPSGSRISRGKPLVNVVEMQKDERVLGMLPVKSFDPGMYVTMVTRSGTVKKTKLEAFSNIRSNGIRAIGIDDDDELVDVRLTTGDMDVLMATRNGYSLRFNERDVRPMGRDARGVKGINLRDNDAVVGMAVIAPENATGTLVTVCERGFGKRTLLEEYPTKKRGGMGVINIKTTDRNGKVTAIRWCEDDHHLILISNKGKLIRMAASDISVVGRATQGVRVMRMAEGEIVASIERLAESDDDDETELGQSGGETGGGDTGAGETGDASQAASADDAAPEAIAEGDTTRAVEAVPETVADETDTVPMRTGAGPDDDPDASDE